jgi:uncharacterized protein with ParB-like and HNH nuclease domain
MVKISLMRAFQPDAITEFIKTNERTFVIPVYQRNYVWKIEDCEKLFDDVLVSIKTGKKHYFGNIVYYQDGIDPFSGYARYILIDGQQRITSTMILLTAIRDEEPDNEKRNLLTYTYLTNEKAEEKFRVKLKQVETDREAYESLVENRLENINKSSVIYRNYNKLRKLVRSAKSELDYTTADLLNGITYLNIILIDLESNLEGSESPQVIFESINATGEPLSTADLLRNFLLLEVGTDRQKEFYENYWLTIEKNVGNENVKDFVRRYITLKSTEDIRINTEYKEFKKSYKEYFKDAEEAIKELAKYSKYYRWIKNPETLSIEQQKTSKLLQDLDDLRMIPATPTIMWLLEKADTGQISFTDVNEVFDVVASWSFRARITNIINTGEIGTILTTKILELLKSKDDLDDLADYLWFELSNYRRHDIYASDNMFKDAFMRYDFYKNYRKYVQQKLSSVISNDQTEIELESIEHIMPQTIRSDKWPGISPGEHVEWVNTIGNLTPLNMPDNIDNSNHAFADKIENIKNSDWQITRVIDTNNGWGIDAIRKRGEELANKALAVWKSPKERTREVEIVKNNTDNERALKYIKLINDLDLQYINIDEEKSNNTYVRFTTEYISTLIPKEDTPGPWNRGQAYYFELQSESTSDKVRIHLDFGADNATEAQLAGQRIVMDFVNKYPPKEDWHWFRPIGWSLECEEGEETIKYEIERVLTLEIPRFEQELKDYISKID